MTPPAPPTPPTPPTPPAPSTPPAPTIPPVRAYLDHAATTALRPAARDAFLEAAAVTGNPTSVHASGRRIRGVMDDALQAIADLLGVPRSWIIMTSGGTEADNLALRGAAHLGSVLGLATDHPAIVETVRDLGGTLIGIDAAGPASTGQMDLEDLAQHLPGAGLVSAALVNNETGITQDLPAIAELAHAAGAAVHTDAVQAVGHVRLPDFETVDLMSLSGHKIGAPVGVGALIAQPDVKLQAVGTGGGQQRGIRSGTLDAANTAAFAAALAEALHDQDAECARITALADRLRAGIRALAPEARFTADGAPHAPHIVHCMIPGTAQDAMLFALDQQRVDASAGSACSAGVTQASHVLEAMGLDEPHMRGALRFSLGWTTTDRDVNVLLAALPDAIAKGRALGALFR